jgi:hypothetical protein
MIALAHFGLTPQQVIAELARREGLSGLEEFARRTPAAPFVSAESAALAAPAASEDPR